MVDDTSDDDVVSGRLVKADVDTSSDDNAVVGRDV